MTNKSISRIELFTNIIKKRIFSKIQKREEGKKIEEIK